MENRFDTDNFEQMLKEKSDEFRMYPSKRVWHSIYNDLHPGRKWPSVAVSMVLVITLMLIGTLNTHDKKLAGSENSITSNKADQNSINNSDDLLNTIAGRPSTDFASSSNDQIAKANDLASQQEKVLLMDLYIKSQQLYNDVNRIKGNSEPQNVSPNSRHTKPDQSGNPAETFFNNTNPNLNSIVASVAGNHISNNTSPVSNAQNNDFSGAEKSPSVTTNNQSLTVSNNAQTKTGSQSSTEDRAWMEDFALHNKTSRAKWKDRTTMGVYITPSIGYRSWGNNMPPGTAAVASIAAASNPNGNSVSQKPSLNLEAGVNLAYSFAKNLSVKTGFQLNYTSYGINADETNHPILTTLTLNDDGRPLVTTRTSTLSNSSGLQAVTKHNTTYQVSVPVGFSVKLAGNSKMEWHAGATIQPSYVFGGATNFISSDYSSYVSDNSLLRRWNMNTGVETYLSYKLSGYTLQVGPQFRYQLMSTYSNKYIMNENLYNVGIKVGIVKGF